VHLFRREVVELQVVRRMHGDELALQVRGELGDLDLVLRGDALQLVAVRLALRGLREIHDAGVPGRQLHADVAVARGPLAHVVEVLQVRAVARELREENRGSLDRLHVRPFSVRFRP
jgi:hypothetical protein